LDAGERDTGGNNKGGASNHTGGNNQGQGRQSQGQEVKVNRGHERQGLQNKTQNKTQKLWIVTHRPISIENTTVWKVLAERRYKLI